MNDKSKNVDYIHWSFWLIGIVTLVWNILGVTNFIMQMNPDSLAAMPEAYRAIIEERPAWATGAFAIAVFGGTLGCLLLLLRKSIAIYVFIASLLGAIVAITHFHFIAGFRPLEAMIGSLMQLVIAVLLVRYSLCVLYQKQGGRP